jgi:putative transposase
MENLKGNFCDTKRIQKLRVKRNNKINDIFHKLSRAIIEYSKENDLGTIVIGYNERWKQNVNLGKKTNQNFVQVPFSNLLQKIKYKATLVGTRVLLQEESYTSKCSFLDNEPIEKRDSHAGIRISRGLFRSSNGTIINADINASYNIMKKAVPNSIVDDGIEGVGLHPLLVAI